MTIESYVKLDTDLFAVETSDVKDISIRAIILQESDGHITFQDNYELFLDDQKIDIKSVACSDIKNIERAINHYIDSNILELVESFEESQFHSFEKY